MALTNRSLILWGYTVTAQNRSIDFKGAVTDAVARQASLRLGYYSLTSIMTEVKRALTEKDPSRVYTVTADRTFNGGLENRITIASNGSYFRLLFASGPRTASTSASLLGFAVTDRTGATTYTGTLTTGTALVPSQVGYTYLSPTEMKKVQGSVNLATSGHKEAVIFNIQEFWQVEFKYESKLAVVSKWAPFLTWAIQQRRLEFTPNYAEPGTLYEGTLEKTTDDGKALGFKLTEMLPNFPNFYTTGLLTFRRSIV